MEVSSSDEANTQAEPQETLTARGIRFGATLKVVQLNVRGLDVKGKR